MDSRNISIVKERVRPASTLGMYSPDADFFCIIVVYSYSLNLVFRSSII